MQGRPGVVGFSGEQSCVVNSASRRGGLGTGPGMSREPRAGGRGGKAEGRPLPSTLGEKSSPGTLSREPPWPCSGTRSLKLSCGTR